jgi:hypothetical protein
LNHFWLRAQVFAHWGQNLQVIHLQVADPSGFLRQLLGFRIAGFTSGGKSLLETGTQMRKLALITITVVVLAAALSASTITVVVATSGGMNSSVAGATTNTFNSALGGSSPYTENGITYTGSFGFYQGSIDGYHRAPTGDITTYISVPSDNAGSSASFSLTGFGSGTNYFGLYWGSLDSYNWITFSNATSSVTLTGSEISSLTGVPFDCPPCGQAAASTYFNFYTSEAFNTVTLGSSNRALETDNHAFAAVPEPTSLALLSPGVLLLLGRFRRKFIQ